MHNHRAAHPSPRALVLHELLAGRRSGGDVVLGPVGEPRPADLAPKLPAPPLELLGDATRFRLQLVAGTQQRITVLSWTERPVRLQVLDQSGRPVIATLEVAGPAPVSGRITGPSGVLELALRPGVWGVAATAERA